LHRNIRLKPTRCTHQSRVLWWAGFHRKRLTLRVFVLGGTGLIGAAVVRELVGRGHELFGLARSGTSAARLDQIGVTSICRRHPIARTLGRKAAAV
jgi:nucleoside-diphosphate-sugar epimerase